MEERQFENLCHAVADGGRQYVENMRLRYIGRVIACHGDILEVEAFDHRFRWPANLCEPCAEERNPLGPQTSH